MARVDLFPDLDLAVVVSALEMCPLFLLPFDGDIVAADGAALFAPFLPGFKSHLVAIPSGLAPPVSRHAA